MARRPHFDIRKRRLLREGRIELGARLLELRARLVERGLRRMLVTFDRGELRALRFERIVIAKRRIERMQARSQLVTLRSLGKQLVAQGNGIGYARGVARQATHGPHGRLRAPSRAPRPRQARCRLQPRLPEPAKALP